MQIKFEGEVEIKKDLLTENFTKDDLKRVTDKHRDDVKKLMGILAGNLKLRANKHDQHKFDTMDKFFDYAKNGFSSRGLKNDWYKEHRKHERHHLQDFPTCVPIHPDVDLLDVLECLADAVAASKARHGKSYNPRFLGEVLLAATKNTFDKLEEVCR